MKFKEGHFVIKKVVIAIFIMVVILLSSCSAPVAFNNDSGSNAVNQNALDVSIINLIATPEKFHGKIVRVIGVGNLEFEGNAIYLSRDDYEQNISGNSLWIELGGGATPYNEAKVFNGKYVIVEGTFDKKAKGHFGIWPGGIKDITRYVLWEET